MSRFSSVFTAALVLAALLPLCGTAPVQAQDDAFLLERTSILAGAFNTRIDTDLRGDGETRDGTPFDFETDLDFENDPTVAVFGISQLLGRRHQVGVRFNRVSRSRQATLNRDIVFDDAVFESGTPVDFSFETETLELDYTFWIMRKQASAFGLTGGVQWQRLGIVLETTQSGSAVGARAEADLPVPLLGFSYRHLLTRRSRFLLTATILPEVHLGDVAAGSFTSVFAAVEWQLLRNVGLGAAYSLGDLSVDVESSSLEGALDYTTEGVQVYARLFF